MAEKAPSDGHKRTCIAPEHNYVGIGVAIHGNQFRYYEEFLDRYIDFVSVRTSADAGEAFSIEVRPFEGGHHIFAVMAYYEPFPRAMTPSEINARSSYGDFSSQKSLSLWPWELKVEPASGGGNHPPEVQQAGS